MPYKFALRKDDNQGIIEEALRAAGASVTDTSRMGSGMPDLLVGYRGHVIVIEVKNPATRYGRRGLNKRQLKWRAESKGRVHVVSSMEEALAVLAIYKIPLVLSGDL